MSYGYKICYREESSEEYVRHYMTYNFRQAIRALTYYKQYPPRAREDGHELNNPTWTIIPISRDEVLAGIGKRVADAVMILDSLKVTPSEMFIEIGVLHRRHVPMRLEVIIFHFI